MVLVLVCGRSIWLRHEHPVVPADEVGRVALHGRSGNFKRSAGVDGFPTLSSVAAMRNPLPFDSKYQPTRLLVAPEEGEVLPRESYAWGDRATQYRFTKISICRKVQ